MTRPNDAEAELRAVLDSFETNLTTPVVGGELVAWVEGVRRAWLPVSERIHAEITQTHPRQFRQIASEDPEMLPRTEQLKAEDAAIEQDRVSLGRIIEGLSEHAPKFEPDESKLCQHTTHVMTEGVALVNRVKKQEVAVQTWFVEAFNRDHGVSG